MPYNTALINTYGKPFEAEIDNRQLMAYAASLGDYSPHYLDTQDSSPVVAHPLFPVCLEWPALLDLGRRELESGLAENEQSRAIHAFHDLHLYRPIYAGDKLTTQATVIGLEQKKPGTFQWIRLDTRDEKENLVCQTYQLGILRDVDLNGPDVSEEPIPTPPTFDNATTIEQEFKLPFHAGLAHIYSECSGIWNPIHTDRAIALAAGLPAIILHGTATLASAVSKLIEQTLGGDPLRVSRVGGRFNAMVVLPSTATLTVHQVGCDRATFSVKNSKGDYAIKDGFICWE